ncbi:MAG: urease subunit beta [Phormidesmis sp.]
MYKADESPKVPLIPGQIIPGSEEMIELNPGREVVPMVVRNVGDRPIQVGSHFHFFEVNEGLEFDRELAKKMRLNITAGTAVRFEPGDEKAVELVPYGGSQEVYGFNGKFDGAELKA